MKLIVILGPTATGKTKLASALAYCISGEIISADSRQVFKRMDIGTGKDLKDYIVNEKNIPHHLIDIFEPGEEFSVFDFQKEFIKAFNNITSRKKIPILCGGTGLYLESVLKPYVFHDVPENKKLREKLDDKSDDELKIILGKKIKLHNTTDTVNRERLLRALEIAEFQSSQKENNLEFPKFEPFVFGINADRKKLREQITSRLRERIHFGMLEEVEALLKEGIKPERLKSYGLEYKFVTQYLLNEIDIDTMFSLLNTAIHQFAKRQMTWFRHMERNGTNIRWIDMELPLDDKVKIIIEQSGLK
ncbi:MAG TPA: tRNA (adenosine(37)-N6)-dimethylallyltransferase MiaA [Bacteroidales bacterium]|nr:tRNA (adenosine(37)-N6)-dimethylallyltransferase MiaA [Bacteroidales bacterium]HPS18312.1 tRNA (adenosine(37)-N6)-dimethylallyltransferase MiaA [Bacteroidales bacterium]